MRTASYVVLLMVAVVVGALVSQTGLVSLPGETPPIRNPTTDATTDRDSTNATAYRTVVVFRNDDVEPGHSDDLRRQVNRIFVEEGVPVTHGVIPTNDGDSIATNESFCRELRQSKREHSELFEYALHGYLHERNDRPSTSARSDVASEFLGLAYGEQRSRLSKGIEAFEECLGERPETFVPPFGTYDDATVRALAAENVSVVSGGGWFTNSYYGETRPFETEGVLHVPRHEGFVRDWDTLAFYGQTHLREHFDQAHDHGDLYVHVLHYWTFTNEEKLQRLRSFLQYAKSHDGVVFMTVGEFADAYRDGRLQKTERGWRYAPP